ncbi:MAG: hypothetical protein JWP91_1023 [Fibrobacteres bacterium]|nr:hypothetical protein [Fibrobacterota bacterium]
MKGPRLLLIGALFAAFILGLYRSAVPRLQAFAIAAYHDQVVKRMVKSKESLVTGPGFRLGLYRPELPYHFQKVFEVEDSLDARVSIISFYQAWGEGKAHDLNRGLLDNIARGGYVPMITWEPWVSAFESHKGASPESSLVMVAEGEFDGYIRAWAREAVRFGRPMYLRYAHEFSNPWYGWSSKYGNDEATFIRAWKHVHGIFREEGARNVAFVWNPYQPSDTLFYPGPEFVDWIGLDVFNFGPVAENGYWIGFSSVLQGLYRSVEGFRKPVMVAEAGSVSEGGSKEEWYREMFRDLASGRFPLVKALVVFDNPSSKAPNGLPVDLSMTSDSTLYARLKAEGLVRKLGIPPKPR